MSSERWKITFKVYRKKGEGEAHYDDFPTEVDPDEYVLDGVERIWAFHDRSLAFRHACHHSTCGACGMRVNGVEKLTCITTIREVTKNGGTVVVEPLRNFPVLSDLVVDTTSFYALMDQARYPAVAPLGKMPEIDSIRESGRDRPGFGQLNDCIECGLCISACPIATTTSTYLGPAVLAGIHFTGLKDDPSLADLADSQDGVWRCHSIFECSEVCPSQVKPGWRLMDLRKQVLAQRIHRFFHPERS